MFLCSPVPTTQGVFLSFFGCNGVPCCKSHHTDSQCNTVQLNIDKPFAMKATDRPRSGSEIHFVWIWETSRMQTESITVEVTQHNLSFPLTMYLFMNSFCRYHSVRLFKIWSPTQIHTQCQRAPLWSSKWTSSSNRLDQQSACTALSFNLKCKLLIPLKPPHPT